MKPTMSSNPYAPPATSEVNFNADPTNHEDELAGRFTRFASAFVDGILMMGITAPVLYATGYYERARLQQLGWFEQIAMSLFGMAVMLGLNGYLLFTRGQTVGKMLTKIQIVDASNGGLLPFLRVYVYRYLWLTPLVIVVAIIPGNLDNFLVNVVAIIDALMIFGQQQRCLHDYIANSKVVLYKPNRMKAS